MKQTITMTVETTATHGPTYIDSTRVMLGRIPYPGHEDSNDWTVKVQIALDIGGNLNVYWMTNADWSVLSDEPELPTEIVAAIATLVRDYALQHNRDDIHALADYCDSVPGCENEK